MSKKSQDTFSSFYNSKFPEFLQEEFEADAKLLTEEVEKELIEACKPGAPDCEKINYVLTKLEVLLISYRPPKQQKELYATILLRFLLEEKVPNQIKSYLMGTIYSLISESSEIKLDWKSIRDFMGELLPSSGTQTSYARGLGGLAKIASRVKRFARKVKVLYPEESVAELIQEIQQGITPSFETYSKGLNMLSIYLNVDKNFSASTYEKILPTIFALWSNKTSMIWDASFLSILVRIARAQPKIDWAPYYQELFNNFFRVIKYNFPKSSTTLVQNYIPMNASHVGFLSRTSPVYLVAEFLIILMKPKSHSQSELFWKNFDSLNRIIIPFIHPENKGDWQKKFARFYENLVKSYIKRSRQEKNAGKSNQEKQDDDDEYLPEDIPELEETERDEKQDKEANEDEDEEEDENQEAKIEENTLDSYAEDKFYELILYVVKNLLLSRDDSVINPLSKICRRLLFWNSEKFSTLFIQTMYDLLGRSDLSHLGYIKILSQTAYPLLSRKVTRNGILELPKILNITLEHLTTHDIAKTYAVIELYEEISGLVPLFHIEDLKETHKNLYGDNYESSVKQKLNYEEDGDLLSLSKEVGEWAIEYFKKLVSIFEYLDKTPAPRKDRLYGLRYSKFSSFIANSSPRLISKYIDILVNYIGDNVQKVPIKMLTSVIIPLNLAAPVETTKKLLGLIKNRLLTKAEPGKVDYSKRKFYHLIPKTSVAKIFDSYELQIVNKEAVNWYLEILVDVLTYSSPALLNHIEDFELILAHCLLHEELSVSNKAADVYSKILFSLFSTYPRNLGFFDEEDLKKENFFKFYKRIGLVNTKNIKLDWHTPNEDEIKYGKYVYDVYFESVIQYVEKNYLAEIQDFELDAENLSQIIDGMHIGSQQVSNIQKQELTSHLHLASSIFTGVLFRSSIQSTIKPNSILKRIDEKISIEFLKETRLRFLRFIEKMIKFCCLKSILADFNVGCSVVISLNNLIGEAEQTELIQGTNSILNIFKKNFEGRNRDTYQSRYLTVLKIDLEFQKRLVRLSQLRLLNETFNNYPLLSWVLNYHSNEDIAKMAGICLRRYSEKVDLETYKNTEATICNLTTRLITDKFSFIHKNNKQIEENGSIKINQYELVKNNKETYVEMILNGSIRSTEYLYSYLSNNLDKLFVLIESLMNTPKKDDPNSITRFWKILRGIDLSMYVHEKEEKEDDKKDSKEEEKSAILKSGELFKAFDKKIEEIAYEAKPFFDKTNAVKFASSELLKILLVLNAEGAHWKLKLVAGIVGVILADLLNPTSPLLLELALDCFKQIFSEHQYLRVLGISCFPKLIRKIATEQKKDAEVKIEKDAFKDFKCNIDQIFDQHFLLKSDYEKNYLREPVGVFDFYKKIQTNLKEVPNLNLPTPFLEKLLDDETINKIITSMINDIPSKEESSGGHHGFNMNFKSIIKFFFGKRSQKPSYGPLEFDPSDARFFSVIFKYCGGIKLFDKLKDKLKELSSDYNSREKQIVSSYIVYGILRAAKNWSPEDSERAFQTIADVFSNSLENVGVDKLPCWLNCFLDGIEGRDQRIIQSFLQKVLINPLTKKSSSVQGRFFMLYSSSISKYGFLSNEISEKLIEILIDFKPVDSRQAIEVSNVIMVLVKHYLSSPINYNKIINEKIVDNVEKIVESSPDRYKVDRGYFLYRINPKIVQVFNNFIAWTKAAETPEEKKIYLEFIFSILGSFKFDRVLISYYSYIQDIIKFLLELNIEELALSPESVQAHETNLTLLATLDYPPQLVSPILEMICSSLNSSSYRVKENALKFYHYFHYNHFYLIKETPISLIQNSLGDENNNVRAKAFDVMVDVFKTQSQVELLKSVEENKKLVSKALSAKDVKEASKGLYTLMALVLSCPYEIEEWTEDVITIVMKNRKNNKPVNDKFTKDFVPKFWDCHKGQANLNQRQLSYDIYSDLREIANPSTYFA